MQGLSAGLTLDGRFELIHLLGRGGMGEIWLAADAELDERVALKLLNQEFSRAPFVDLLRQECRQARALVHPNIVRVYDFHAGDSLYYISMQYIEGDTLAAARGDAFQSIVHQVLMVCDALEYAHRAGIIHRDVKPSNVLRDRNGACYLSDFGIASALSGRRETADLRGGGSLPCMSPQQLAGEPAAVADDVYALGATLYDLLSGAPLFHPQVTEARVRDEIPPALSRDGAGQALPESLAQLVRAMLDKSAARRPAGISALRSVLEEIRADYPLGAAAEAGREGVERTDGELIRPVTRSASARARTRAASAAGPARARRERKGLPPRLVYAGLGLLLLVAAGVIFFLPNLVEDRPPVVRERVEPRPEAPPVPGDDPAASLAQRQIADEVLGELLAADDRLRALGVEFWGGTDWSQARELTETGDASYRQRDYADALTHYRQALNRMELIEVRAPQVLAGALRDGRAALEAMDQESAVRSFEIAMAVDASNAEAREGLERAMKIEDVRTLLARARELEAADELREAQSVYRQIIDLDPAMQAAREGDERTGAMLALNEYETRMAAGFSALAGDDLTRARGAFNAALSARPGDSAAREAIKQLDADERLRRIIELQKAGRAAELAEQWQLAVSKYSAILEIDDTVVSARQDLDRSRRRADLQQRLERQIANVVSFNDDKIARAADAVLQQARAVGDAGPVLTAQIEKLAELLRIAAMPVSVEFRSDNLTDVVIYKVGRLGMFSTRTLDLKPGGYVAVGSRVGYRDVRRTFMVVADGKMPPIELSCEEPI